MTTTDRQTEPDAGDGGAGRHRAPTEDLIDESIAADPAAVQAGDEAAAANAAARRDTGARGVVRNSALMAVAAVVSRVTGLLAKIFITAVLAFSVVNDSYTLANTLPNIVFELLLGGVLTSVAIPLLTRARKDPDGGAAYTQQLITLSLVGLLAVTALAVLAAPALIALYLSSDFHGDRDLATQLAYLLLPQIFFYGLAGLFGAILNSRERFAAPAWAPVVNNVVVIATAIALAFTVSGFNTVVATGPGGDPIYGDPTATQLLILGVGTTAGIVAQAAVLLPPLRRVGFRFKWRFGWDRRMSEALGLAGWAVVYVLVSQVGYIAFTLLAGRVEGGISQYYWANLLFQTPYGILGVSVLTAIMPRMSRHAAEGDLPAVKADMSLANRLSAVALIPVSAAFIALAGAIGVAASFYGKVSVDDAITVGLTCAGLAVGLLALAMTLVQMRVFYAFKDARTPVLINAVMVAVRIPLFLVGTRVEPRLFVPALALATAISYLVGAAVGELWLRHRFGPMGTRRVLRTIGLMSIASIIGGGAALGAVTLVWGGFPDTLAEAVLQCMVGGAVGLIVVLGVALLLRVEELEPLRRRLLTRLHREVTPAGTVSETDVGAPDATPRPDPTSREQVGAPVSGETSADQSPEQEAADHSSAVDVSDDESRPASAEDTLPATGEPTPAETTDALGIGRGTGRLVKSPQLAPGSMVGGRYRLVSLVAVDANGDLFWRAKDTVLPRDMAVTLLPEGPNTNATVTRTLRAGRLHHIGLPQTLDLGNEADHAYVVSQWVDGATLTDLLAGGPLSGEVASGITAKVADAVAEAHRNGIALGALHPSLVRVNFDGQVRLSHVISYPGATEEQDIRAVGALLYLMLTGTYPLRQSGMSPPLPVAPTRGGQELPADEANQSAPPALAALAERTLHPEGTHGVRSASAISALLADVEGDQPPLVGDDDEPVLTPRQLAEQRLMKERRVKLGIAGAMLLALTVLLTIVIGSVITRIVDSVQDPVITSDQRIDVPTTTLAPTGGGAPPAGTGGSAPATTAAVVEKPVAITSGEVYDPEGTGTKDYTSYVDRAFDADPGSAWQTYDYKQQFGPDGLKDGVGLLLTLESAVRPSTVVVGTTTPGITVEIRTSDGNVDAALDTTQVLATSEVGTSPAAIAIPATAPTSQYLIVFVTGLSGTDGTYYATISNIAVSTA